MIPGLTNLTSLDLDSLAAALAPAQSTAAFGTSNPTQPANQVK